MAKPSRLRCPALALSFIGPHGPVKTFLRVLNDTWARTVQATFELDEQLTELETLTSGPPDLGLVLIVRTTNHIACRPRC